MPTNTVVAPDAFTAMWMSIADFVPSNAIVFSIGHSPTADQVSRSASLPSSTVMHITLPLSCPQYT